jgi:hypothetical protein
MKLPERRRKPGPRQHVGNTHLGNGEKPTGRDERQELQKAGVR